MVISGDVTLLFLFFATLVANLLLAPERHTACFTMLRNPLSVHWHLFLLPNITRTYTEGFTSDFQCVRVLTSRPKGKTSVLYQNKHSLENTPIAQHHLQHMYQHRSLQSSVFIRLLPLTCFSTSLLQGRHLQSSGV